MFDIVFKNGKVVDGTGNPWYRADVGIRGNYIQSIRPEINEDAYSTIDISDLYISPGFIDTHSHSDLMLLKESQRPEKIRQGVTTEVLGQDGTAPAPVPGTHKAFWKDYNKGLNGKLESDWPFSTMGEYLNALEGQTNTNVLSLVPHGALRLQTVGLDNREATSEELNSMSNLLAKSMEEGGIGLSTGLIYTPCTFAPTIELKRLCSTVSRKGGIFVVHMRNEGSWIFKALSEVIEVGKETGVPVHISHLGAQSKKVWGKGDRIVETILEAREEGVDATCDQYPYTAGSTLLSALIPPWVFEKHSENLREALKDQDTREKILDFLEEHTVEEWDSHFHRVGADNIYISSVSSEANKQLQGRPLPEAAEMRNEGIFETVLNILIEEDMEASMVVFLCQEEDVETIMKSKFQMFCTDGLLGGFPHPRVYGSFPRVLRKYVQEEEVLELEQAIRKMTSLPANRLSLSTRGIVKEGFRADLTIFDINEVNDRATYEEPAKFPTGIRHVLVNGNFVVKDEQPTDSKPGKVIKIRNP
ncbi:D-aminoacylase [Candidatus Bipolaricaulota bacterium]|nr:D-aminoacylase [Candidatus Bipolaricaulota bacterium]MBS3792110.1 D-aminoacylase [Candidatus Bipolaricaulota bacterium]